MATTASRGSRLLLAPAGRVRPGRPRTRLACRLPTRTRGGRGMPACFHLGLALPCPAQPNELAPRTTQLGPGRAAGTPPLPSPSPSSLRLTRGIRARRRGFQVWRPLARAPARRASPDADGGAFGRTQAAAAREATIREGTAAPGLCGLRWSLPPDPD